MFLCFLTSFSPTPCASYRAADCAAVARALSHARRGSKAQGRQEHRAHDAGESARLSKSHLFGASPGGMRDSAIPPSTTRKPSEPASHTPGFPSWNQHGVHVRIAILPVGQLDRGGVHVQQRNEIDRRRRVHQNLIRAVDGLVRPGSAAARSPKTPPAPESRRTAFSSAGGAAEDRRQIAVDSDGKREPRRAATVGADAAGIPTDTSSAASTPRSPDRSKPAPDVMA